MTSNMSFGKKLSKRQNYGQDKLKAFADYKTDATQKEKINPFPNDKISDSSQLTEFKDDNVKFDENGRVPKKFLLVPQCFQ